jgi:tetratricopeptide (TPR) repeat protein
VPAPRVRRLACAAVALSIAAGLFHADVALAVVTRGDDALRLGETVSAIRFYRRALWLDPGSTIAADRLAFSLALRHDQQDAREAVDAATSVLRRTPAGALFADRALAEVELRRWQDAEGDFARAARLDHDPRYDHFAARMALRTGRRRQARDHELEALTMDGHFSPAQHFLRESH